MRNSTDNNSLQSTSLNRLVIDYILIPIFFLILIMVLFYFFDKAAAIVAQSIIQGYVPENIDSSLL